MGFAFCLRACGVPPVGPASRTHLMTQGGGISVTPGNPTGKVKRFMQTAVQTTSEATSGLQAAGRQRGAKGKQPGGFAALLTAFFGKGNAAKGMAPETKGEGPEAGTLLKGKAPSGKKAVLSMAEGKGPVKKGASAEAEDIKGNGDEAVTELLAGLAVSPLVPAVKSGGPALAEGQLEHGPEKNAGAPGKSGAKVPFTKGGMAPGPIQGGGAAPAGKVPQPAGEVGVDRFAEMVRGAADGKKATRQEAAPLSAPGASPASADVKVPAAAAGIAEGLGNTLARSGNRATVRGAKAASPAEVAPDGAGAARLAKKDHPAMAPGAGARPRTTPTDEPAAAPLQSVKSAGVDRAGAPVVPTPSDVVAAAANELEPSSSVDTPKSGLTRQLALQVGRQIATSLKKNDREVTFQVRPPSLGRIQIRIEKEGEGVSVRIVSEKEKAGEILAAGKHDLRALMADHGIRLDRIEVATGATMDFMAQNGGGMEGRSGRGRSSPRQGGQGGAGEPEGEASGPAKREHEGAISVVA
ncbi:flagellar hook-length control protein-like c-terminal [Desulfoluna butyratoxydans]|uniref:Flagellar hook-length control protein-like c-terminal n=2 Tax=Desulfoluna butyratoxydans TaxID=231438 RepID=A0A4U8YM62_9BACT|nr:flagellar hook-length control protein-like c-terminal [Desulfoluna butyratoxydans]